MSGLHERENIKFQSKGLIKDFVLISEGFFNSNLQRPDQGKSFQNSDPFKIVNPNPSIIIARKKRSSFSCNIHESVCKYWCRIAGHSTGSCDIEVIFKKSLRLETLEFRIEL